MRNTSDRVPERRRATSLTCAKQKSICDGRIGDSERPPTAVGGLQKVARLGGCGDRRAIQAERLSGAHGHVAEQNGFRNAACELEIACRRLAAPHCPPGPTLVV